MTLPTPLTLAFALLLALGTAVLFAVLATPGNAAGGSKSSCNPAPYWMEDSGNFSTTHAGIGGFHFRTLHHRTGPDDKEKYRISWHVNPGYAICKVLRYRSHGQVDRMPTGLKSGHYDWEAYLGSDTGLRGTRVYVRKAH